MNLATLVQKSEIFSGRRVDEIERFLAGSSLKRLRGREHLYQAGQDLDSFSLVISGFLKVYRHSPRGDEVIMHFAVEGDLIGALLMNREDVGVFPVSVKSVGISEVICIPKSTYIQSWCNHTDLQLGINRLLSKRMNQLQDDKLLFAAPLSVRIANLLLRKIEDSEVESSDYGFVHGLTRQEIANSLGVAVESVIRIMSEWFKDGTLVKLKDRGLEYIDPAKLVKKMNY